MPNSNIEQTNTMDSTVLQDVRLAKINRWSLHLLDLSFRNRLLNLKSGRQSIEFVCDNIASLENRMHEQALPVQSCRKSSLQDETSVSVDFFNDADETAREKTEKTSAKNGGVIDNSDNWLQMDGDHIWSRLPQKELDKSLLVLFRQSRTDLDEGGVNTLFLAFGTLLWSDQNCNSSRFAFWKKSSPASNSSERTADGDPNSVNVSDSEIQPPESPADDAALSSETGQSTDSGPLRQTNEVDPSKTNESELPEANADSIATVVAVGTSETDKIELPEADESEPPEADADSIATVVAVGTSETDKIELPEAAPDSKAASPCPAPSNQSSGSPQGKQYRAPIILIPVQLERQSARSTFKLKLRDEDTVVNTTLLEFLRRETGIVFPEFAKDLQTDDAGVDVDAILKLIQQKIANIPGCELLPELWLSRFSFSKYIMYTDLNDRWEKLANNSVVSRLIDAAPHEDARQESEQDEKQESNPKSDQEEDPNKDLDESPKSDSDADQNAESDAESVSVGQTTDNQAAPPASATIGSSGSLPVSYQKLYLPVSADASQTQAVLRSQTGESFVLYGPPGTGKSQTITNLIAHNLALGRRVLFVSEKRAALDVVYNRLSKIGLSPFCLELHSNKAGKKETLEQFNQTIRLVEQSDNTAVWSKTCAQLSQKEDCLDQYVSMIHQPHANGLTAFDCIGGILNAQEAEEPLFPANIGVFSNDLDFSTFSVPEIRRFVERLQEHAAGLSIDYLVGMSAVKSWSWTPDNQNKLQNAAQTLQSAFDSLIQEAEKIRQALNFPETSESETSGSTAPCPISYDFLSLIPKILDFFKSSRPILPSICDPAFSSRIPDLAPWIERFSQLESASEPLRDFDLSRIVSADLDDLQKKLDYNQGRFFLFRYIANRFLTKEWSFIKRSDAGVPLTHTELTTVLPAMKQYKDAYWQNKRDSSLLEYLFGSLWQGDQTDYSDLKNRLLRTRQLQIIMNEGKLPPERQSEFIQMVYNSLENKSGENNSGENNSGENNSGENNSETATIPDGQIFSRLLREYESALIRLQSEINLSDASYSAIVPLIQTILSAPDKLRSFSFYLELAEQGSQSGLKPFIESIKAGKINDINRLTAIFDLEFRKQTLDEIIAQSPEFNHFSGLNQLQTVQTYRQLFDKYMKQTREQIVSILFERTRAILAKGEERGGSIKAELTLLRKEIGKKMLHLPIRSLLEKIPQLTASLKPCLLMSPLSVAQYLPAEHSDYDLVVFDEASQITTWDAVGVIARGKQLIVVGDPQQMPPTNFFQKQQDSSESPAFDDPEESNQTDLESILDECISLNMPGSYLNTHYRSRHESLIAFSNHFYYQDRLSTFPSASQSNDQLGIQFVYVPNGIYDRAKTRTNRLEAQKVVEIVCERLKNPQTANRSIGIVTFSLTQKELIEELLEQAAKEIPELDVAMSEDNPEPLFVKNLESVQGDERDCMLFAIGYGPDARGKVAMNFGPLNRIGGHRRLNVAITRAKYQIIVVSSLHGEDIDLNRTKALGAAHLKYFLQYAQSGRPNWNLPSRALQNPSVACADFASFVAQFLEQNGFRVTRNFGLSNYTIDLAVENPNQPGDYQWAVECDGPIYKDAPSSRERDVLRESVLRGLGWTPLRIWSVEWYHDCEKAQLRLLEQLNAEK